MTLIDFVNLLINVLIEGLVVALPALAMTLVMGVNRFPNAATGDMLTTGAYAAVAVQLLGGWPLWAAALISMAVTAVVSAGSYTLIFRKLAGRPMVSSMLAALGGVLLGMKAVVSPEMGWESLIPAFAAMVLGGIGSPVGAVLGALLLCVAQELAVPLMGPSYKLVLSFVVLALVLLVRPAGIMGRVQLVR